MSRAVPQGWTSKPVRELADVVYGQSPNSVRVEHSDVPMYGTGGRVGFASRALFECAGVVVPRKGSLGNPLYSASQFWVIDTAFAALPKPDIDPKWLYYNLDAFDLTKLNEATGVPSLSRDWLLKIRFLTPPSNEQRKIARILSTVDALIQMSEAVIAKQELARTGLLDDVFRAKQSFKPFSCLPPIPSAWVTSTFGAEFNVQLGKMLSKVAKSGAGELPYIGNRHVQWEAVQIDSVETMNFSDSEREKFRLRLGDLLVCEGGEVGRAAIWRDELEECYFQKALHRLQSKGRVHAEYALAFLLYGYRHRLFEDFTSQTSIAHLTQEKLCSMPIAFPAEQAEQLELIRGFQFAGTLLDKARVELTKLRSLKTALMQDLLSGKVRVQPDAVSA